MTTPELYLSTSEDIEDVILTTGTGDPPYSYYSAYSVTAPSLSSDDVVHVTARAELTSTLTYQVLVGRFISRSQDYGGSEPPVVTFPPNAEYLTSPGDMFHMTVDTNLWVTGLPRLFHRGEEQNLN